LAALFAFEGINPSRDNSLVCFFPKLSVMKNQQVEGCEGIKAKQGRKPFLSL